MLLPNVGHAIEGWAHPYTVKTVTRETVDFETVVSVSERSVDAMVQPAQKERLTAANLDWSLKYFTVHQTAGDPLQVGEFIVIGGQDYKIIEAGDFSAFGFTKALAEQSKRGAQ